MSRLPSLMPMADLVWPCYGGTVRPRGHGPMPPLNELLDQPEYVEWSRSAQIRMFISKTIFCIHNKCHVHLATQSLSDKPRVTSSVSGQWHATDTQLCGRYGRKPSVSSFKFNQVYVHTDRWRIQSYAVIKRAKRVEHCAAVKRAKRVEHCAAMKRAKRVEHTLPWSEQNWRNIALPWSEQNGWNTALPRSEQNGWNTRCHEASKTGGTLRCREASKTGETLRCHEASKTAGTLASLPWSEQNGRNTALYPMKHGVIIAWRKARQTYINKWSQKRQYNNNSRDNNIQPRWYDVTATFRHEANKAEGTLRFHEASKTEGTLRFHEASKTEGTLRFHEAGNAKDRNTSPNKSFIKQDAVRCKIFVNDNNTYTNVYSNILLTTMTTTSRQRRRWRRRIWWYTVLPQLIACSAISRVCSEVGIKTQWMMMASNFLPRKIRRQLSNVRLRERGVIACPVAGCDGCGGCGGCARRLWR